MTRQIRNKMAIGRHIGILGVSWAIVGLLTSSSDGIDRTRISEFDLTQLRGSSHAKQSNRSTCNDMNIGNGCTGKKPEAPCTECSKSFYTTLTDVMLKNGFKSGDGPAQNCGRNYRGKCKSDKKKIVHCDAPKAGPTGRGGACKAGPNPDPQQTTPVPSPPTPSSTEASFEAQGER